MIIDLNHRFSNADNSPGFDGELGDRESYFSRPRANHHINLRVTARFLLAEVSSWEERTCWLLEELVPPVRSFRLKV